MATSSTEAVSNSNHQPYRLGHNNIINSVREKIWNGDIVATASTHGFWEPDKEFKIKVKVNKLKRKFHQNRYLQIKHLPRDVTEEEIHQMLSDFPIGSVILSCGHGSAGSAKVYLEDPEMLEEWDKDRTFLLRGQKIPVSPALTELVLCVARCPLSYGDSQFSGLVRSFGEVKMSFLMISEKTGESKGYGFVEYVSKELALHAKSKLDGMAINDVTLCADFIDSTHITFESLHSKCLYVDNLPDNYRDMGEFRRKFSKVVNPPYCQIALKNGCPQNWGLVEFNTGEDAENTLNHLNGCELKDKKLRISYYIPGVRAINLYLRLLNEGDGNRGKGNGLLPTPPPSVMESFKNLQKQNPVFAQSIQNIVVTERQLGVGNNGVGTAPNGQNCDDVKNSYKAGGAARKKCRGTTKPPMNYGPCSDTPSSSSPDIPLDQTSLFRLLSGQHPNPTLLQSPQMASFLKQFKGVLNGGAAGHPLIPPAIPAHDPAGLPISTAVPGMVPAIPVIPTIPDYAGRGVFVDPVKASGAPVNMIGVNRAVDQASAATFTGKAGEKIAGQPSIWNSNAALAASEGDLTDKTNLEDSLLLPQGPHLPFAGPQVGTFPQRPGLGFAALLPGTHPLTRSIPPVPGLQPVITEPPQRTLPQTPADGFRAGWFPRAAVLDSPRFPIPAPVIAPATPDNGLALIGQNAVLPILVENPSAALAGDALNLGNLITKQAYEFAAGEQQKHFTFGVEEKKKRNGHPYRNGRSSAESETAEPESPKPRMAATPVRQRWPAESTPAANSALVQPSLRPIGFEARWRYSGKTRPAAPPAGTYTWSDPFAGTATAATPVGQKRKSSRFLPSPERSPECDYVGQHLQGIGGHYMDSWPKRKKKN